MRKINSHTHIDNSNDNDNYSRIAIFIIYLFIYFISRIIGYYVKVFVVHTNKNSALIFAI